MHLSLRIRLLLLIALCLSAAIAQAPKLTVNDLGWLSGCWEANINGREIVEQWMKPAGQTMLGMSRTVTNGRTTGYEFTQIREEKDGAIYYVAKPSSQTEAAFKLIKTSEPGSSL